MSGSVMPDSVTAACQPYWPTVQQFEACDINPDRFDHEAHVFVAWTYLQALELLEAIDRYRTTLRRLTRKLGAEGKYHETITWFFMIVIAERCTGDAATDFTKFKFENPGLFQTKPGILDAYYSTSRLMSEQARERFLLPDKAA